MCFIPNILVIVLLLFIIYRFISYTVVVNEHRLNTDTHIDLIFFKITKNKKFLCSGSVAGGRHLAETAVLVFFLAGHNSARAA